MNPIIKTQIERVVTSETTDLIRKSFTSANNKSMNSISSLDNTNEKKGFSSYYTRTYCKCIHPFLDAGGSASSVCNGLSYLFLLGMMFGLIMPKNQDLPTPWYRYTSSIVGYAYFIFWCVSFYPQIISNYERKSTEGLSADFSVINFIGYFCYAIYTCALYWNEGIKELYRDRHKSEFGDAKITVQSNDVAFALHAVLFAGVWQFQLFVYGGMNFRQGVNPMSKTSMIIILLIILSISFYAMMICKGFGIVRDDSMNGSTSTRGMLPRWIVVYLNWLDFIYFLSFVKVFITFYKYIPQVILNARRKTCVGWSIWTVILDFAGAMLSFAQLLGDAIDIGDYSSITGNIAKLGLSVISVGFDITFFLQHYLWYPHHHAVMGEEEGNKELELIIDD